MRIVAATAARIDAKRYQLSAWFLGPDGPLAAELRASGASVRVLNWWRGARDPVGAWRFVRSLHDQNFAIIHQHYGGRSVSWLARTGTRASLIVHLHGRVVEPHTIPVPIRVRGADAVVAVSHAVARQVQGATPRLVYSGTEVGVSVHSGSATGRVLGVACRLVPIKGLVHLLRALASLRMEFSDLHLQIAGAGPERPALDEDIRALGLNDAVRFLGWQADLAPWLAGWDIFVQPSLEEGLPIAAMEAMAAGLPVVATAVGGTPELVEDGKTGWLVPPGDPAALVQRIRALLLNPEQARVIGAAGRARVREKFSTDRMVTELSAIYDELTTSEG